MKIGNVVKLAIKWAPVIYPIIKKLIDSNKGGPTNSSSTNRRK